MSLTGSTIHVLLCALIALSAASWRTPKCGRECDSGHRDDPKSCCRTWGFTDGFCKAATNGTVNESRALLCQNGTTADLLNRCVLTNATLARAYPGIKSQCDKKEKKNKKRKPIRGFRMRDRNPKNKKPGSKKPKFGK